ncbi:MAG TPA: M15 family metallopeptidase [Candidatus Paceibacterota bacterium]|nr:M15 family metallopeptidase [Candidatus Paceibacterota bacterium]
MELHSKELSPALIAALTIGLVAVGGYSIYLGTTVHALRSDIASSTAAAEDATQQKLVALSDILYSTQQSVSAIEGRLGGFEDSVGDISNTVDDLEKLRNTDPQLLQKYSKVYFLNENYVPKSLKTIPAQYVSNTGRTEQFLSQIEPDLIDLIEDAKDDGVDLFVASAYRSFAQQKTLKTGYAVTYGAGANAFSADQGYSEHQLGTAVDFTTAVGAPIDGFDKTGAYQWLLKNAYKYGFILSYPQGNGYYVFEPWHWRYVGKKLAKDLHREDENFYQMEQRDIDQYLINFFD